MWKSHATTCSHAARQSVGAVCATLVMLLVGSHAAAQQVLPPLAILCTLAGDEAVSRTAIKPAPVARAAPGPDAGGKAAAPASPTECGSRQAMSRGVLAGPGEVLVVVSAKSWEEARQKANNAPLRPKLFLNGISAGEDSALFSIEFITPEAVDLKYFVTGNKATRALWTALYRERNMAASSPMRVSIGWDNAPAGASFVSDPLAGPSISVTTDTRETIGFTVMALLFAFLVYGVLGTDVFRDLAARPAELVPDLPKPLAPGTLVRATYSLARLQAGLWLAVVLGAGMFMWIVLGEMPAPEPTLIGLLGVSTATTLASLAVDSGAGTRPFVRSRNLFHDILTGWDGAQQLHRSQAVAVNLVLLVIVIDHVVRNLAYPAIDGTLLALLGVSGIAQTGGKQVVETTPDTGPGGPMKTAGSPVPSGRGL